MSLEHQTIGNCTPKLEVFFKNPEREIVHYLRKEGFITQSLCDDVLNPRSMLSEADKAGMIVEAIRDVVFLDKGMFHTLVAYLQTKGKYYSAIVKNLTEEFSRLGGVKQHIGTNPSPGQSTVNSEREKQYGGQQPPPPPAGTGGEATGTGGEATTLQKAGEGNCQPDFNKKTLELYTGPSVVSY